MLTRRSLLAAVPALLAPLPAWASPNPLQGLQPPDIIGVKFTEDRDITRLEFFWNSPEEPTYLLTTKTARFEMSPALAACWPADKPIPEGPKNREELLQLAIEDVTLTREDLRFFRERAGFSALEAHTRGLWFLCPRWQKEQGVWVPRFAFSTILTSYGRIVTREEWVDALLTYREGPEWSREMVRRFGIKRHPQWEGWTLEEEDLLKERLGRPL